MHASVEGAGAGNSSVVSEASLGGDAVSGSGPRGAVVPVASAVCCSSLEGGRVADVVAEDRGGAVLRLADPACRTSVEGISTGGSAAEDIVGGDTARGQRPLMLIRERALEVDRRPGNQSDGIGKGLKGPHADARTSPALQLKMQFREQALVAPVYDLGVQGSGRGWAGRSDRLQIKSGRMASMLFHSPPFFFF